MTLKSYEIRARRAVEKLTQDQFAKKLGISRQHLIDIEADKVRKIGAEIERRYDELYNGHRLISITWSRGVSCPYPDCFDKDNLDEKRVWPEDASPDRDVLNDVYVCNSCMRTFTVRQAWKMD